MDDSWQQSHVCASTTIAYLTTLHSFPSGAPSPPSERARLQMRHLREELRECRMSQPAQDDPHRRTEALVGISIWAKSTHILHCIFFDFPAATFVRSTSSGSPIWGPICLPVFIRKKPRRRKQLRKLASLKFSHLPSHYIIVLFWYYLLVRNHLSSKT